MGVMLFQLYNETISKHTFKFIATILMRMLSAIIYAIIEVTLPLILCWKATKNSSTLNSMNLILQ